MTVSPELIAQLNRQLGKANVPTVAPLSPSGNGNLRSGYVPDSVPNSLPKGLTENGARQPVNTPPKAPEIPKPNTPTPLPNASGLADKLNAGAARLAGGLAAAQSVGNFAKDRSLGNGLSLLGSGLLLAPNPIAQGIGLVATIAGALLNAFKPLENLNNPNSGSNNTINPTQTYGETGQIYRVWLSGGGYYGHTEPSTVTTSPPSDQTIRASGFQLVAPFSVKAIVRITPTSTHFNVIVFGTAQGDKSAVFPVALNDSNLAGLSQSVAPNVVTIYKIVKENDSVPLPNFNNNFGQQQGNLITPVNNDGWKLPDLDKLKDLSDGIDFSGLAKNNNGLPVLLPNLTPKTLPNPNETKDDNNDSQTKPKILPIVNPFSDGNIPSFEALPFVSGVSDPDDQFNPRDSKTGLTREQFDQKILEERQKTRDKQNANQVAAKKNDDKINAQLNPQNTAQPNRTPSAKRVDTFTRLGDPVKTNQNSPVGKPLPSTNPLNNPNPTTTTDRFKEPSDCNFSCKALADCFVDVKVKIFDGCDFEKSEAKTKEITVQALPKDVDKTKETFKQLLDIRSNECAIDKNVITVPDYWRTRVGQIPQAIVLYKSVPTDGSKPSYYQLQIPHYNGSRTSKPKFSQYRKGNEYAIYYCKDGSSVQVNCSTKQECLRVITELEKYINPRMRESDRSLIKYGTRKGLAGITVTPVRLDFSSLGQAKSSPDWSISLLTKK